MSDPDELTDAPPRSPRLGCLGHPGLGFGLGGTCAAMGEVDEPDASLTQSCHFGLGTDFCAEGSVTLTVTDARYTPRSRPTSRTAGRNTLHP